MCSPPRHQWFFMDDISKPPGHHWLFDSYDSKRDCLNMLATSPPMIFHGWYFKASVRNDSPPRHQGILNSYLSKRVCLDRSATSPPTIFQEWFVTFWFIWFNESLFWYARHLATRAFWIDIVSREVFWICLQPRYQWFWRIISQSIYFEWLWAFSPEFYKINWTTNFWGQIEGYRKFDSSPPFLSEACKSHMLWIFWI